MADILGLIYDVVQQSMPILYASLSGIQITSRPKYKVMLQEQLMVYLSELYYTHSIALLQDRFCQPHKLINAHIKSLTNMASPTNSLST